ncbi:MAG: NYN domain-containing protein [Candidatus Woesearchaeota archaeon]
MESLEHKEQKVLVLFDVQNMYYSAKNIFNAKVNFGEILKHAVGKRKLIRAIAYVIKTEIKEEESFHKALMNFGIEVKQKDLQTFVGGAKKGDWDIGIAMDAVRLANKVDTVVLVSGDGDFKDLLSYLNSHGCRTEVIAFSKTASKHIKEEADSFFDLESNRRKFLIPIARKVVYKDNKEDAPNEGSI